MTSRTLWTIHPELPVTSQEWMGELKHGAPPFEELSKIIGTGCQTIEVVAVHNFAGQPGHMFIDEDGIAKGLPYNPLASLITGRHRIYGTALIWEGDLQ